MVFKLTVKFKTAAKPKIYRTRGSAMIEGAIYFPLVIICLAFTVLMFIYFYRITALSAHVHMVVRDEAGIRSGTTTHESKNTPSDRYRSEAENMKVKIKEEGGILRSYVSGSVNRKYVGGKLTRDKYINRRTSARSYIVRDKLLVRVKSVVIDR